MAATKNAPRRPRTKAGKPKPVPWIVNDCTFNEAFKLPLKDGQRIDLVRLDGTREDGVPFGRGALHTHPAFFITRRAETGGVFTHPTLIVLYRRHDPSDPAPKPRAKKELPVPADWPRDTALYDVVCARLGKALVEHPGPPVVAGRAIADAVKADDLARADALLREATDGRLAVVPEGFIAHDGKSRPVPADKIVEVLFRDGDREGPKPAGSYDACWYTGLPGQSPPVPNKNDIVAYRVLEPLPDELPRSMTGLTPVQEPAIDLVPAPFTPVPPAISSAVRTGGMPVVDEEADSFAVFAWTCLLIVAIAGAAYGALHVAQQMGVLP